jgi:hypothetical protein
LGDLGQAKVRLLFLQQMSQMGQQHGLGVRQNTRILLRPCEV